MAKILAVDDSASMRQMVAFTLKGAGHDVVEQVVVVEDAADLVNVLVVVADIDDSL